MDRLHPWLTRTRAVYLCAAVLMAAAGWWLTARGDVPAASPAAPVSPLVTMAAPPAPPGPLVHVVGAVRNPGVYRVPAGARALAAVRRAGGPTRRADLSGLNLAAEVVDGAQLVVPERGAVPVPAATGGTASGPLRLSTATPAELEALDGIGPALAARIVDWREEHGAFGTVDDLLDVPGIGESKLEALRDQVVP